MSGAHAQVQGRLARTAVGGIAWVALVGGAVAGKLDLGTIEQLFLFAPLVIVPLGLELLHGLDGAAQPAVVERFARLAQPFAALLAAASFWFPPGRMAALLAVGWLLLCGALALGGLVRLWRGALAQLDAACGAMALLYLPVGGAWLVASRLGLKPMGFHEPIVLLTAVHFHYAGFAGPLIARATGMALAHRQDLFRTIYRVVALGVLAGPGLLAAGFVLGPGVKLAAAFVLGISQMGLAVSMLVALRGLANRVARTLLGFAAGSLILAMAEAALWALGEYPLHPFVNLAHMARFHGVANALGFIFCGSIGWWIALPEIRRIEVAAFEDLKAHGVALGAKQ